MSGGLHQDAVAIEFIDFLLVLPFLMDTAGNAATLYDSITWFDDEELSRLVERLTGGTR